MTTAVIHRELKLLALNLLPSAGSYKMSISVFRLTKTKTKNKITKLLSCYRKTRDTSCCFSSICSLFNVHDNSDLYAVLCFTITINLQFRRVVISSVSLTAVDFAIQVIQHIIYC